MADKTLQVDYAAVLADLKAKRAALDTAISAIEQMSGISGGVAPATAPLAGSKVVDPIRIESDTFFNMTVPDAVRKYLGIMRKPQSTPQIAEALERGGFTHQSEKFGNTVGAVLHRISTSGGDIVKVSRGNWGLASWYGPKRSGSSTREDSDQTNGTPA